jgi:hypothetical protein
MNTFRAKFTFVDRFDGHSFWFIFRFKKSKALSFDKSTHFFDKSISSIIEFDISDQSLCARSIFKYEKRLMIIHIRYPPQEIGL